MALFAVLVAFLSASQDIVIDAYRVELLEERQQGAGAAMVVIGYRVAMLLAGAGALFVAEFAGWFWAYAAMAACLGLGMVTVLFAPEPRAAGAPLAPAAPGAAWLREAVVEPFADFFRRNGVGTAMLILLFIMLYKLGDALLGTMTNPFYVELGFTKPEVATIVKGYGLVATLLGGFLGGVIVNRRGIVPALWICGVIQLLSNLVFVLQAWVGHDLTMLAVTISVENLAGGMGTAAFVAYLSSLCNLSYTATQYALLSSFMAQARTTLSAGGGYLAESMDWVGFFLTTTAAAVPGLLLLLLLQRRLAGADARPAHGRQHSAGAEAGMSRIARLAALAALLAALAPAPARAAGTAPFSAGDQHRWGHRHLLPDRRRHLPAAARPSAVTSDRLPDRGLRGLGGQCRSGRSGPDAAGAGAVGHALRRGHRYGRLRRPQPRQPAARAVLARGRDLPRPHHRAQLGAADRRPARAGGSISARPPRAPR